jgi:hypothetical protein
MSKDSVNIHPTPEDDPVVAMRHLDRDGHVVECIGGVWCDPLTGARSDPIRRQVIRESAWTTVLRISDEAAR